MPACDLGTVVAEVAGPAHGLAVHRQHPPTPCRVETGGPLRHETTEHGIEPVGIDPAQQAADRRLRRDTPHESQRCVGLVGQVSGSLGDRDQRTCFSGNRADRDGQQHDQAMADTAALTWIGDRAQRFSQPGSEFDEVRQLTPAHPGPRQQRSRKMHTRTRLSRATIKGVGTSRSPPRAVPAPHLSPRVTAAQHRSPRLCRPPG